MNRCCLSLACCVRVTSVRPFSSESQPPGKNRGLLRRSEEVFDFLDGHRTGFLRDLPGGRQQRRPTPGPLGWRFGSGHCFVLQRERRVRRRHCRRNYLAAFTRVLLVVRTVRVPRACLITLGGACASLEPVACLGKILGERSLKAAHTYSSALRCCVVLTSSGCVRCRAQSRLAASWRYVIFTNTVPEGSVSKHWEAKATRESS